MNHLCEGEGESLWQVECFCNKNLQKFCFDLPKIELHAHLHGSIRPSTLLELLKDKDDDEVKLLRDILTIGNNDGRSLSDCFRIFKGIHRAVRSRHALQRIVHECLDDFFEENVVYLELRSTPRCLFDKGQKLTKRDYVRIVIDSIQEWQEKHTNNSLNKEINRCYPMEVRLLLSIDRAGSLEDAMDTVEIAKEFRHSSVNDPMIVGIDLGGNPTIGRGEFTTRYQPALLRARELGMPISVHTAEVWDDDELAYIMDFLPDRLGHVVCISEKDLQQYFIRGRASDTPIEICLTSNSKTRPELYDCHTLNKSKECPEFGNGSKEHCVCDKHICMCGFRQHPLKELLKTQHPICLCTDDRGVFENSVSDEYVKAAIAFNLKPNNLVSIALRAIPAIFAPESMKVTVKERMINQISLFSQRM